MVCPAVAPHCLLLLLQGCFLVFRFLFCGPPLQLPALHGHRLSRLSLLRRIFQIQILYPSHRLIAGHHRPGCPPVVSAASVDFHLIHLLEPLALHRPEFRPDDDVRSPRRPFSVGAGTPRPSSCLHRLLHSADAQLPHRQLARPAHPPPRPSGEIHLACPRHPRHFLSRFQHLGPHFAFPPRLLEVSAPRGHPGQHAISLVSSSRAHRTLQRQGSPANPLLQRHSRHLALRPIFMDHQLLPEERSSSS